MSTESSANATISLKEFTQLKEEMLEIKHLNENSLTKLESYFESKFSKKFEEVNSYFQMYDIRLAELKDNLVTDKANLDRIPELLKINKNTGDDIFSLQTKISNLQKEIMNIYNKYDKIFVEQLELPGYIGNNNKFANIRDYLDVS